MMLGLLAIATTAAPADASVSVALSIDDVAKASTIVVRATPIEQASAWENGRIVTTTRLRVERFIAGKASGSELSVRTLGGIVGDIGQRVEGEAVFSPKTPSIVFLKATEGTFIVAGRAQGQLVVMKDARTAREIVRVRETGGLVPRPQRIPYALPALSPPVTSFDGRDADDMTNEAARAWERTHAK
jgi:hypothetical protein